MMSYELDPKGVRLTPEQAKSRRLRNIAIGLVIGAIVVLFYAVTIVKVGPGVTKPPI
jgi:hypothetical protein